MQHIQVIEAADIMDAREAYLARLGQGGVELTPATEIYVETIHRPDPRVADNWLCYTAGPRDRAA